MHRNPRLLVLCSDNDAPGFYRLGEPYSLLARQMPEIDVQIAYAVGLVDMGALERLIIWSDAIITQRPMFGFNVGLIRFAKAYGKQIIIDFDDALLHIPDDSPVAEQWGSSTEAYRWQLDALKLADWLHLSTPELVKGYRPFTRARMAVFLNGLPVDHEKYDDRYRRRAELPLDRPVVMWHGVPCHADTYRFLNNILRCCAQERPQALFAVCSTQWDWAEKLEIPDNQKVNVKGIEVRRFASLPSLADIHLTPLHRPTVFHHGKSELKVLQAAIWSLPAISSPTAPYRRFHAISGGANLLVPGNSIRRWRDAVFSLIDDDALRRELGEAALRATREHYSLARINGGRATFYRQLFGLDCAGSPGTPVGSELQPGAS